MKKVICLQCGQEDPFIDEQCSNCGAVLPEADLMVPPNLPEDEFAELDYRPKSKKGLIIPVAIIVVVVLFSIIGVLALTNDRPDSVIDEPEKMSPGTEQVQQPSEHEPGDEQELEAGTDQETVEQLFPPSTPPDYSLLAAGMQNWLVERTGDGDVILLHTDELEDVEGFFERYDLVDDNVIVYRIDLEENQFATVLFGLPFSEWSTKVVFIWRDDQWNFLREQDVN